MIACVRLPYFAETLAEHADLSLIDTPFILSEPPAQPRIVYAVSAPAAQAGLRSGMTVHEALAVEKTLHIVPATRTRDRRILSNVLETLSQFTSRVEADHGLELRTDDRRRKRPPAGLPASQIDDYPATVCYLDLGKLPEDEVWVMAEQMQDVLATQHNLASAIGLVSTRFTCAGYLRRPA